MNSLYPTRRLPQWIILIGWALMALGLVLAVGHFGFDIPVYSRDTGYPSSHFSVAMLVLAFEGVGVLLALAGRAWLRAASRYLAD